MEAWPDGDIDSVEYTGAGVVLWWGDHQRHLPRLWLRDNCPCAECRHHETGEHAVLIGREPIDLSVVDARANGSDLEVGWSSGHRSVYPAAWFRWIVELDLVACHETSFWLADHQPLRVDHDSLLASSEVRHRCFSELARRGVVVVEGTPVEPGEVGRFLNALGVPVRETPFDRIHDVFLDPTGYNVAHTSHALPPHNDFASYRWPPSGQLLHFLVNDAEGGNSVLVDGFAAVDRLQRENPAAVDVLATVDVPFREFSAHAESFTRAPLVRRDGAGTVRGLRFSNQLMQPLSLSEPRLEEWYEAYRQLSTIIEDPSHQVEFRCNAGDMQMVHGHRVLHARREFRPSTGARHLQDTYFEMQDVFGQLDRLEGRLRG